MIKTSSYLSYYTSWYSGKLGQPENIWKDKLDDKVKEGSIATGFSSYRWKRCIIRRRLEGRIYLSGGLVVVASFVN